LEASGREEMITMMYWYGSGMSGWGYALMTVSVVLFWGAVIFGIVMLVRYFGRSGRPPVEPRPPQSPERLLAERFARGEIDEEEYRQRLAVLRGEGQPANAQVRPPAGTSTR
jgi:putative membrane protein